MKIIVGHSDIYTRYVASVFAEHTT